MPHAILGTLLYDDVYVLSLFSGVLVSVPFSYRIPFLVALIALIPGTYTLVRRTSVSLPHAATGGAVPRRASVTQNVVQLQVPCCCL